MQSGGVWRGTAIRRRRTVISGGSECYIIELYSNQAAQEYDRGAEAAVAGWRRQATLRRVEGCSCRQRWHRHAGYIEVEQPGCRGVPCRFGDVQLTRELDAQGINVGHHYTGKQAAAAAHGHSRLILINYSD